MKDLRSHLQKVVILLNFRPFTYVFEGIYALGLKVLLAVLARCPAVHSVFGSGSFFEGRCLFGLSDIDLIIVVDEKYSRIDPEANDIFFAYNGVRRFFPFLGNWHEKVENLIFLSEVEAGFPPPESFRFRAKQGRLYLLYGSPCLEECWKGTVSISETIAEVGNLLRISLTKGEDHSNNLLFWKRIFSKLIALAETLDLHDLAQDMRTNNELYFLGKDDVHLFMREGNPDESFRLLLGFSTRMFDEIKEKTDEISLCLTPGDDHPGEHSRAEQAGSKIRQSAALRAIGKKVRANLKTLHSPLFGLLPRLNYCPIEEHIVVVELEDASYTELRTVANTLGAHGELFESLIVKTGDSLFIMSNLSTYVDIVPLDHLNHANVYAQLFREDDCFETPVPIYEEQKVSADRICNALAGVYRKNEGWIAKLPFPCVYLEDDLITIRDAFHRMRVFLVHKEGMDTKNLDTLVDLLGRRHPECREFLLDLLGYYRALSGNTNGRDFGGNLYRCLHQFMAQLLAGEPRIAIDDHRRHLGITVGIITRNRAADLRDALDSLTRQDRAADEVLILDNGSTDDTRKVIDSFRESLPITYHFLAEPSIPKARNMVIENAGHEIIAFTDDDCIVEERWLQSVERGFLRARNVGMVGGWVRHEWSAKESIIDTYYSLYHSHQS